MEQHTDLFQRNAKANFASSEQQSCCTGALTYEQVLLVGVHR